MSVLILVLIALPGGLVTSLLAHRRSLAFAIGLATAVASALAAASIDAADVVPVAGSLIGGSDGLRTLAVAWAASVLLFGILDALLDFSPGVLGPSLVGLAFGASALAVQDPGIGFALVGAGAVLTAVIPISMAKADADSGPTLAVRTLRPLVASVVLTLLVVAWGASPAGPFNATGLSGEVAPALELTMGLALLALVAAVVLRLGAIPGHAWVARFAEAMPASAVPPLLGWGAAAFVLVALGWIDVTLAPLTAPLSVERSIITIVAVAGIVLGGLAAILHDDIEHVLAYSIVQDAGIAMLAFAAPGATVAAAGRDWILAAVAVKAGLAAWVHVTRMTFGTNRRLELRGWARRAPLLGIAFGLVVVGAIGMPTFAGFEARGTLIRLAVPGPAGTLVLLTAFAPLIFLGRLVVDGLGAGAGPVREATGISPDFDLGRSVAWAGDRAPRRVVPAMIRTNRLPLAAATAILATLVGLSVSIGGLGSTTLTDVPLAGDGGAPGSSAPVSP